jgi:antirestriction protein ArdC
VDTIAEAGAAAMEASNYLIDLQQTESKSRNTEKRIQAVAVG